MNKPSVFISHSSKDESVVRALSDALRKKTGGAIEIFVSSDGQSMPLGRNWVHSVEEALNRASLMFVLLSPNSIGSQWIYFEAGYSYSQKRRVIPIGIPGVDLGVLSPPMSLLQGFNIISPESLDNLLVLMNKEFGHAHDGKFTQDEYNLIFGQARQRVDPLLREFVEWIDHVQVTMRLPFDTLKPHIEKALTAANVEFRSGGYNVVSYGAHYRRQVYDPHNRPAEERTLELDLAPSLCTANLRCFQQAIVSYMKEAQDDVAPEASLQIYFAPWVSYVKEIHRLTAKLPGSGIRFGEHNDFVYADRSFYLSRGRHEGPAEDYAERVELRLRVPGDQLTRYNLVDLLRTLVQQEIVFAGEVM